MYPHPVMTAQGDAEHHGSLTGDGGGGGRHRGPGRVGGEVIVCLYCLVCRYLNLFKIWLAVGSSFFVLLETLSKRGGSTPI